MPAEFILLLMAAIPVIVTYMDIWGDPRPDPRTAGLAAPRAPQSTEPLRFVAEATNQLIAARHAATLGALTLRRPAGPDFLLKPLPVPAAHAVPSWAWYDIAQAVTIADPFAPKPPASLRCVQDRHAAPVAALAGQVASDDLSFASYG